MHRLEQQNAFRQNLHTAQQRIRPNINDMPRALLDKIVTNSRHTLYPYLPEKRADK